MPHGFPSLNLRARDAATHCLGIHGSVTVPQFAHPVYLITNTGVGSKEIIELAIRAIKRVFFTNLKLSVIRFKQFRVT